MVVARGQCLPAEALAERKVPVAIACGCWPHSGTCPRPAKSNSAALALATTELRADGSRLTFTTEFTFAEHEGRTLLTMIQTGLPTAELRDEHGYGLPNAFARLARIIRAQR